MARLLTRLGLVTVLTGLLTTGLLVTTTQTASALDVHWGTADKAAARALIGTFARGGVQRAAPGVIARMGARCVGPQVAGCAAGVAAVVGVGVIAYKTSDMWVPWLENQIGSGPADGVVSGKETCANYPAGQCDTMQYFGALTFDPAPTKTGTSFTVKATGMGGAVQGRIPAVVVGMDCADGYHDATAVSVDLTPDPRMIAVVHPCSAKGGLVKVHVTGAHGGAYYVTNTWNPVQWNNTLDWEVPQGIDTSVPNPSSVNCKRPDGTTYQKQGTGETTSTGQVAVPSCDLGDTMTGYMVGGVFTDMTPSASDHTNFPVCDEQNCLYRILVDGKACTEGVEACTHWSYLARSEPERVECHYGPYLVGLDLCYSLERTYETTDEARELTSKNTDGNPDTFTGPAPSTSPVPKPAPSPSPMPSPSPSPSPSPTTTATSTPTPTPTTTIPAVGCATPYALGAVKPVTAAGVNYLGPLFDVGTVYGYGTRPDGGEHPLGLAADFMVGNFQGDQLAAHAKQRAGYLSIQYIIWEQRIWNVDRAAEGWRLMEDRGSPTANHMDHVHISFKDTGGALCATDPGDMTGDTNCFGEQVEFTRPLTWIVGPLRCLFEPRTPLSNRTGLVTSKFEEKGPGQLIGTLGDAMAAVPVGSGCEGPLMPFDMSDYGVEVDIHPLDACSGAMATVAGYVKILLTVMISFQGVLAVIRTLGGAFGLYVDARFGSSGGAYDRGA